MKNRITKPFMVLICALMLGLSMSVTAFAADQVGYSDVPADHWAAAEIYELQAAGVMNGTGNQKFLPDAYLTRAAFMQSLFNLSGADSTEYAGRAPAFSDVDGHWAKAAVNWAFEKGITKGNAYGQFAPDQHMTRQEVAAFLYRYAAASGTPLEATEKPVVYLDEASISDYAKEAVMQLQMAGVLYGFSRHYNEVYFIPGANVTRAELAKMLVYFLPEDYAYELPAYPNSSATENAGHLSMEPVGPAYHDVSSMTALQIETAERIWIVMEECFPKGFYAALNFKTAQDAQNAFDGYVQIAYYLENKQLDTYGRVFLEYTGRHHAAETITSNFIFRPIESSWEEEAQIDAFVQQAIRSIGLNTSWTEKDAAWAICRYVADFYDYDLSYRSTPLSVSLYTKKGVCWHYAMLTQAICKEVGIECAYVLGHTEPGKSSTHAWNYMEISGVWCWADVCWQDGRSDNKYMPTVQELENHYAEKCDY